MMKRMIIVPDKALFFVRKVLIVFLFPHDNIHYGYLLEVPHHGTSNEYPKHIFVENYFLSFFFFFLS